MPDDRYYPDLSQISLPELGRRLGNARLLPSQQVLGEQLAERLAVLQEHGLHDLAGLQAALKNKAAVARLAAETGLPVDFLTVLRREVNGYQPKPLRLADFPGVEPALVEGLAQLGIANTRQLFLHIQTPASREAFARQHNLDPQGLLDLARLTDVARARWVGPRFARLLVAAGYGSMARLASADPAELLADLARANPDGSLYGGALGLADLRLWIEQAVPDVPLVVEW